MFGFSKDPGPPSIAPDPAKLQIQPNESLTFTLRDNRTLGYASYGSSKLSNPTIFFSHGMPGSRVCGRSWDQLCARIGARLIVIDRGGCGQSSYYANRKITDWPEDVLQLADHLQVSQFSVIGASGGGPYALACARFIPKERLRSTTVVCGIGTMDSVLDNTPGLSWRLGGFTKWFVGLIARLFILPSILRPYVTQDPARLKSVIEAQAKADKVHSDDPSGETTVDDDTVLQFLEAFRNGSEGCRHDGSLLTRDWGFDVKDIDKERKRFLWHGDKDVIAPLYMAKWIDDRMGGGKLRVLDGHTHFTIWKEHSEEIFTQSARA